MPLRSVMAHFREDQIERSASMAEAARSAKSRAQVVCEVVDRSLASAYDTARAQRYATAYPTLTHGTDAWGSLDAWHDAAFCSPRRPRAYSRSTGGGWVASWGHQAGKLFA
jgi:hypothetical protein